MDHALFGSSNLAIAYAAYVVGTASPGPSNLAIMAVAMHSGRRAALVLALGVVCGSAFWGMLAAFGLSGLLATWSGLLVALKLAGGAYLSYLALRSARSALRPPPPAEARELVRGDGAKLFARGAAMHLTNPKAIFVWLSIVALALPAGASAWDALTIVLGCVPLGLAVFGGYAIAFSTAVARRVYARTRRGFDAALAAVFGYAAWRALSTRVG